MTETLETTLFNDVKAYRIAHRRLLNAITETAQAARIALIDGDAPSYLRQEMKQRLSDTLSFLTATLSNETETIDDAVSLLWEVKDELTED